MALTLRERIMQAAEQALITGLPGVAVDRGRDTPVVVYPSVVLLDGEHDFDDEDTGNYGSDTVFMALYCELYVDAATTAALPTAINALYGDVVAALMLDYSLGGLLFQLRERHMDKPEPLRGEGQAPTAGSTVEFLAQYYRVEGDPFTLGNV